MQIPWIKELADNAAKLAVDLESFVPSHPDSQGQVKMTNAAIGKLCRNKPAIRIILPDQFRVHLYNLTTKKPGGIH